MDLIVIIPVYNEEGCIQEVVSSWNEYFLKLFQQGSFKIILINDGSKDNTPAILDKLSAQFPTIEVVHQINGGHGNAVMNGYKKAVSQNPDWIFQTDSDNQFLPKDFIQLWEKREDSKFILGYRKKRNDDANRLVITRIVRMINLLFFGTFILDSNIPYRLMKGDYLAKLIPLVPKDAFAPNIFLSILAKRDGNDIMSIPVTHIERKTGIVSIIQWKLIKVSFRTFRELSRFSLSINKKLKSIN